MTTVMLIADNHAGQPVVGPDAAERLGSLGITRIALLRDESSTAVVLEGWAFDPARTDEATRAVFPAGGTRLRTFHEVQHVAVSSAHQAWEKK
jgi:hypothetical protein